MPYLSHAKDYQGVADVFLRDPDRYAPLLQFIQTGELARVIEDLGESRRVRRAEDGRVSVH